MELNPDIVNEGAARCAPTRKLLGELLSERFIQRKVFFAILA
jgi:hypothetical protein